MLSMFILGVGLLLAVLLLSRWYVAADPKTLLKALKWAGLSLAMCVVVWLALSGKLWAAIAALPAMMIWFMRLFTGLRYMQMFRRMVGLGSSGAGWASPGAGASFNGGSKSGQHSDVRTRFVAMRLDHATGQISGEVLDGRFAGRQLIDLNLDELLELLAEVQGDVDSVRVVESYLERRAPGWRTRQKTASSPPGSPSGNMTRAEALRVLGLKDGASADDIKAAHRRLMAQVHPDHGGTDYLAQQINQAKDVLLG